MKKICRHCYESDDVEDNNGRRRGFDTLPVAAYGLCDLCDGEKGENEEAEKRILKPVEEEAVKDDE